MENCSKIRLSFRLIVHYEFPHVCFSSIGFAKAALESINGINLFGDQGASWSVIFVDIDAHNRNRTIFESILPRESNSKVLYECICFIGWTNIFI